MQESQEAQAERTKARRFFALFWSAVLLVVLLAFRAIMVPFILALVIAYVLSPLLRRVENARPGGMQIPRWAAILTLYVCMLTGMGVAIRWSAPRIAVETRGFLRDEVPHLRRELRHRWLPQFRALSERMFGAPVQPVDDTVSMSASNEPESDPSLRVEPRREGGYRVVLPPDGLRVERDREGGTWTLRPNTGRTEERPTDELGALLERVRSLGEGHTGDLLRVGRDVVGGIIGGVFNFFITLMLSAYLLLTERQILGFLRSLVDPSRRDAFDQLLARLDRGLSGVVRGQLLICGVNGVLSAVGFAMAGLPYWPLLALLAAVFSLVPIFGSILSSVPAVAVGLRSGVGTALFVLGWIVGIHQLEANLLNPKILGDSAKIHPVLVVFSLLAGEHFFGIMGALLAVPVLSIVQSVFLHWRKYALAYDEDAVDSDSHPPTSSVPSVAAATANASEPKPATST